MADLIINNNPAAAVLILTPEIDEAHQQWMTLGDTFSYRWSQYCSNTLRGHYAKFREVRPLFDTEEFAKIAAYLREFRRPAALERTQKV